MTLDNGAQLKVDAYINEYFLPEPVLPLKKRRMQSAGGRPGGDMLGDLRVFRAVAGDHQHDVIDRNGF